MSPIHETQRGRFSGFRADWYWRRGHARFTKDYVVKEFLIQIMAAYHWPLLVVRASEYLFVESDGSWAE